MENSKKISSEKYRITIHSSMIIKFGGCFALFNPSSILVNLSYLVKVINVDLIQVLLLENH